MEWRDTNPMIDGYLVYIWGNMPEFDSYGKGKVAHYIAIFDYYI